LSHGLPEISRIEQYIPWLKEAKRKLGEIGVLMSINPWVTLNHEDRGLDLSDIFPDMQWMEGYTGISAKSCACPLSPAWQKWIVEAYKRYASAGPDILWLEDDFRNFNHLPVRYGCFCQLHLKTFSKRIDKQISRKTLVQNILKPGTPHPMRALWFDFLGDVMVDIAKKLEKAVHEINPNTKLGLMTSHPWHHSVEGRKWKKLLTSLAGPHEIIVRPTLGNYHESSAHGLYTQSDTMRRTVFCLPEPHRICPELENSPYTRFSKSVLFTKAQICLSMLMGASDITMNLFDHVGSPLSIEPGYGQMLKDSKPYFDALAERCRPEGKELGVGVLHSTNACNFTVLGKDADYEDLFPNDNGWRMPLEAMGFPVTFESSEVTAVTGQILRAFKDDIPMIFSKGVLLDLSAVETLIDMGYGHLIGVDIERIFLRTDIPISAEEIISPESGSETNEKYMSLCRVSINGRIGKFKPLKNSRVISRFVNKDRKYVMPGFVVFENSSGGRTAVCPYDFSKGAGTSFLNWHRKKQLKEVIAWLNRGKVELFVEGGTYMIPLRIDYPDYIIIAVMNLSSDSWPYIQATLDMKDRDIQRVEYLKPDGRWIKIENFKKVTDKYGIKIILPVKPGYLELAAFVIRTE
jgi:hypothetical protein